MKIFKHRNIMGLIYGVILAIPMFSILVRSAYVVVNKNAKDSYSGKNVEAEEIIETSYDDLVIGKTYQAFMTETTNTFTQLVINASNVKNVSNNVLYPDIIQLTFTKTNVNYIVGSDGTNYFYFNSNTIQFTYGGTILDGTAYEYTTFNEIVFNDNAYLDNAFDYSLSEYVSENSFGNLNFFEWWSNLFLDLNNPKSALYIHFVNWYMNYVLFVSSSYILFMVLMWFINYSRRLMERGLNYDW